MGTNEGLFGISWRFGGRGVHVSGNAFPMNDVGLHALCEDHTVQKTLSLTSTPPPSNAQPSRSCADLRPVDKLLKHQEFIYVLLNRVDDGLSGASSRTSSRRRQDDTSLANKAFVMRVPHPLRILHVRLMYPPRPLFSHKATRIVEQVVCPAHQPIPAAIPAADNSIAGHDGLDGREVF